VLRQLCGTGDALESRVQAVYRRGDWMEVPIRTGWKCLSGSAYQALAAGGGGADDPTLPVYAGALPPVGAEPWHWSKAWTERASRRAEPAPEPLPE
jgi:hypothetical protein